MVGLADDKVGGEMFWWVMVLGCLVCLFDFVERVRLPGGGLGETQGEVLMRSGRVGSDG